MGEASVKVQGPILAVARASGGEGRVFGRAGGQGVRGSPGASWGVADG